MATLFGTKQAPEFTKDLDWINTRRPVRLSELRGRVVLLDFWTYGCINCRHVQPRLRELERRFPDSLTVIGVHSGKFAHERITANLAAACDRQDVTHAVVNDRHYRIWRAYDVNAWPTTALVGADGALLGVQAGEFALEPMADAIENAIESAEHRGLMVRAPDPVTAPQGRHVGELRFPGRVLLLGEPGASASLSSAPTRLWISDTGHGRVLECSLDVRSAAATVRAEHEGFVEPQGLLFRDGLYIADRADQAVWRLREGSERERVAGTGTLAENRLAPGHGPSVALRSPWGLAEWKDGVVVTMAGSHQLWLLDPVSLHLEPMAGTGGEDVVDGPRHRALLAQPTGATRVDGSIAFADCESSAIRVADEDAVRTVVGTGLFNFGDRDGEGDRVLLQHAEDLAHAGDGTLAVADTYNDRLKRVDIASREARPWPGEAGEAGGLREPAGVSAWNGWIAIADTGNHRVVLVGDDGSLREVVLV